ncbi:unnamed protein product, partial [Symbiodinium pilosum]
DKFYAGLQFLLKVMPALGEGADSKPALALKAKIHGYLDETEKLKAELDSGEASKVPDGNQLALDDDVDGCLERGEDLILSGQKLAERGKLGQAYETYCEGIQLLLKAMPRLSEDTGPQVARLRSKISKYLEEAESVKEERDQQSRQDNGRDRGARDRDFRRGDRRPSHSQDSEGPRRNGRQSRSGRRLELRSAAEVEDEGHRSRGREVGRAPPPGDWEDRNGRERHRSRRDSNRDRRSPREASRSRTWTKEKAPSWQETCRPKSAARPMASLSAAPPLLRPKSAAKPAKR